MADIDPGGFINSAISAYHQGEAANAQVMAILAVAAALNQIAEAVEGTRD
jgi:hypothetical protein